MASTLSGSVVGLDLSATSCGIAWATGCVAVTHEATPDGTLSDWAHRLQTLADEVLDQVFALCPRLVIVEAPILPRPFSKGASQMATSGNYHERAGLYCLVVCTLKAHGYAVHSVKPSALKIFLTGNGNADKKAMKAAAARFFPAHWIRTDDEADALACCAAGHEWNGSPIGLLPQEQRELLIPPPWASEEEHERHKRWLQRRQRAKKPRQPSRKKKVLTDGDQPANLSESQTPTGIGREQQCHPVNSASLRNRPNASSASSRKTRRKPTA